MDFDSDRYYTPEGVALRVLERSDLPRNPVTCADSTCGTGRLLEAASTVYGTGRCLGLDSDRNVIAALRRKRPQWILSVGDLMNPHSYRASQVAKADEHTDLLILNPPFSQGRRKSVNIKFEGHEFKGSLAMAYLLRSFELFQPLQGAIAIVPESLLYSAIDAEAREVLSKKYAMKLIAELTAATFSGTRAHASAIQFTVDGNSIKPGVPFAKSKPITIDVVRGSLPVHLMKEEKGGTPYVHTTDIHRFFCHGKAKTFRRTKSAAKGKTSGWVILVPRVGTPSLATLKVIRLDRTVQLSDCVIALECRTKADASSVATRIERSLEMFIDLYRGTGARYITLDRLSERLASMNIHVTTPG